MCAARDFLTSSRRGLPGRETELLEGPLVTAIAAPEVNEHVSRLRAQPEGVPELLTLRAGESIRAVICYAHADLRAVSAPPSASLCPHLTETAITRHRGNCPSVPRASNHARSTLRATHAT